MVSRLWDARTPSASPYSGLTDDNHFDGLDSNHFDGVENNRFDGLDSNHFDGLDNNHFDGLDSNHFDGLDSNHFDALDDSHFDGLDNNRDRLITGPQLQCDLPPSPPHLSSRTTSRCNSVWCDTFRRKLSALSTLNMGAVASLSIFVSTKLHRVMYQDCNIIWI